MKKISCFFFLVVIGCTQKPAHEHQIKSDNKTFQLKYAEGFSVTYNGSIKEVEVLHPFQGAASGYKYLLVPRNEPVPAHDASTRVIRTPLQSIVCTSTSHIPLLDYLGESDKLTGFPTTDYVSSEKIRARIDSGKVKDLGLDKGMNLELLAVLHPDMVMGYSLTSDYGQFKKIETLGVPVVINSEYLEKHPLGRAEWIKFMGLFFNKEKEADSVFNMIEKNYLHAKSLAEKVNKKPTVLSGIVYGDGWFMPGGENYASKILKDAGCKYLWEEDSTSGFIQLSFESVYARAKGADLWIGTATYTSLQEIKNADIRYTRFKPFIEHHVYNYDARSGAKGGHVFMELGYLRPDIILNDLVKIAHPELLPDYQLFFYRKLD